MAQATSVLHLVVSRPISFKAAQTFRMQNCFVPLVSRLVPPPCASSQTCISPFFSCNLKRFFGRSGTGNAVPWSRRCGPKTLIGQVYINIVQQAQIPLAVLDYAFLDHLLLLALLTSFVTTTLESFTCTSCPLRQCITLCWTFPFLRSGQSLGQRLPPR